LGRTEDDRRANHRRRRRRGAAGAGTEQRGEEHECEAGRHRHKQNILIWLRLFSADRAEKKTACARRRRFAINNSQDSSAYAANFK
jgi:hypothetical protein